MHVVVGLAIIVGSFLGSLQYMQTGFDGFWSPYAIILLLGVPLGIAVASYRFGAWATTAGVLGRALTQQIDGDRLQILEALVQFGRAVRSNRARDGYALIESVQDPIFQLLGRQVLQRADVEQMEGDGITVAQRELNDYHAAERLLNTLGAAAPAVGMAGTVIGLIELLVNLEDFASLGPGMAIALLTTLYGLILGHVIYLPLARLAGELGQGRAQTLGMLIDGMGVIARQRPMHELRQVLSVEADLGEGNAPDRAASS